MEFAYTRLVADDVPRLSKFYQELLGVTASGTDDYVELRPGGATLAIMSTRAASSIYGGDWPSSAHGAAILEFLVDDVDAEAGRIGGIVTDWVMRPKDMPWGNRSMMFRDPVGNVINVFTPLRREA